MFIHLTHRSANRKVGPIPVSTTDESSCPAECPLRGTDCYARFGPLGMHWKKVGKGERKATGWVEFCAEIRKFLPGQLWRHNQAGDMPPNDKGEMDSKQCEALSAASQHTRGWTYTHYSPLKKPNADVIRAMNAEKGLTVNMSADSLEEADEYLDLDIGPVTVIMPTDTPARGNTTPRGVPIVICPAQTCEEVTCASCKLCQVKSRKTIVGFRSHGTARRRLSAKIEANQNLTQITLTA